MGIGSSYVCLGSRRDEIGARTSQRRIRDVSTGHVKCAPSYADLPRLIPLRPSFRMALSTAPGVASTPERRSAVSILRRP